MDNISSRLQTLNSHFAGNCASDVKSIKLGDHSYAEVVDLAPHFKNKLDYFNKQGWGYADSYFEYVKKTDSIRFGGSKYMYSGYTLPELKKWIAAVVSLNFDSPKPQ